MENINYFDIIVLSLALLIGLKGLLNGVVKEFFGILGIVGGVFLASRYSLEAGKFIDENIIHLQNEAATNLFGFMIIFVGTWVVAYFVGSMLKGMTTLSGLGIFDRLFGFMFGAGKVLLIFSVILYALASVDFVKKMTSKYTENSMVYPHLIDIGQMVVKIDPKMLKEQGKPLLGAPGVPDMNVTKVLNDQNGTGNKQ